MSQPEGWDEAESNRLGRIANGTACPECMGTGVDIENDLDCCGNYLDTGECCAAIHGTANLVPVQIQVQCAACEGLG